MPPAGSSSRKSRGPRHHACREVHQLLLAVGQLRRGRSGEIGDADEFEELHRPVALLAEDRRLHQALEAARRRLHHDVLEHGQVAELAADLEGAADAHPGDAVGHQALDAIALEPDLARVGAMQAVDHVEHGGLAGAVRPDQRGDRALLDREGAAVDGLDAAEGLLRIADFEEGHAAVASGDPTRRGAASRAPSEHHVRSSTGFGQTRSDVPGNWPSG